MRLFLKTARHCAVIVTVILFFYTFCFAQNDDIKGVQLKDGSIVCGKVIKMNVDDIQIETADGKIISHKFDEVEDFITTENLAGIRFKDGSILYGKITEIDMNKVTIVTKDNKTITRNINEVASFVKEGEEKRIKHSFALGTEISYFKYKESVMEDKGMMYGITGSYTFHINKMMLKTEGKFAYGQMDYDGATWEMTPVNESGIPDYMLEFRWLLGYDFVVAKNITITPDFGVGYRWLQDNSQEKSTSGYQRESNYLYFPVGVGIITPLDKSWSLGANIEYDFLMWGEQKTYLSDYNPGLNNIGSRQTRGYGARGSISIARKGERVGFVIEPYIRYWNIADSDYEPVTYYGTFLTYAIEPSNESVEFGCKLAITF